MRVVEDVAAPVDFGDQLGGGPLGVSLQAAVVCDGSSELPDLLGEGANASLAAAARARRPKSGRHVRRRGAPLACMLAS